ncbi:hypothetical protein [Streptomyces avicenniae]|uniref:hypothetical protein n=1 Tax=Streptomyces avicenniae TaxID=500153 RepID=UPI00167EF06E|nr:hypothetical protein [Streptomyces avicenniae]
MGNYRGPAVVILDNGRQLSVTADLRTSTVSGRPSWQGTLSTPISSQPVELINLGQGVLRVGTRDGAFVRADISDWLGSPAGLFQLTIEGNGDAPF